MNTQPVLSRRKLLTAATTASALVAAPALLTGGSLLPSAFATTTATRMVIVNALNVRSGPGLRYRVIATLSYGTRVSASDAPQWSDGYQWVEIEIASAGLTGWVAEQHLGLPGVGGWPAGTPVYVHSNSLNLRKGPSLSYSVIRTYKRGSGATVLGGPRTADGYTWYRVETDNGVIGWFAAAFLSW